MKKPLLIIVLVTMLVFTLTACKTEETLISDEEQTNAENILNEELGTEELSKKAAEEISKALKDSQWVKEHVSMKKTCFDENMTGEQVLTFERLNNELVIVQAYSYDIENDNANFGTQVFLVGYRDGNVKVISKCPQDAPMHPGHGGYAVDIENLILAEGWMNQGCVRSAYYKISELGFEKIDSLNYDSETDFNEAEYREFISRYDTHAIDKTLNDF